MSLLIASLVDAALVLALGLAAAAALRRRSAALRHAVIASAIVAASLMPAFELLLPQLTVLRWQDAGSVISSGTMLVSDGSAAGAVSRDADPDAGVSWTALAALLWILGAAAIGAGLVTGLLRLSRLRRRCTPLEGRWRELAAELAGECGVRREVALLQSADPSLLVTCGVLNPAIILPATAAGWTDERRRIVLRHELAHIARHDAAVQLGGEALRILHWMNPLVWIACRRLRQESEYACDDAVLGGGVEATDYATHLLEVARQLSARHAAWAAAPAIAHPSTLERRIAAMLRRHQNRAPLGRRGWAAAALVSLCICIPLAAAGVGPAPEAGIAADVTLVPPGVAPAAASGALLQGTATVSGQVVDQSGGTLPGVNVALTNPRTAEQISTYTNAAGRFTFRGVRPSAYDLVLQLPGFKTVTDSVTVADGASVQRAITMPLGSLQETVTVVCSGTPARASAPLSVWVPASLPRVHGSPGRWIVSRVFPVVSAQEPAPPQPIRVGGSLRPPKKIRDVKPACPPGAPEGETAVRLSGTVDTDGNISGLTSEPPDTGVAAPADVVEAAIDAVRQWKFTPTLLNGRPVDVEIMVDITFRKS